MTVADHHKLAKHSARLAKYHQKVQEERERLIVLYKVDETPTTEQPLSGKPDMAVVTAMGNVNRDLMTFQENYKNKPHPLYAPPDILKYIEMKTGLTSSQTSLQTTINAVTLKQINRGQDDDKANAETYMEARRRILTLCEIAPAITEDAKLMEASDPKIGLQNLHAWCVEAAKPSPPWYKRISSKLWGWIVAGVLFVWGIIKDQLTDFIKHLFDVLKTAVENHHLFRH